MNILLETQSAPNALEWLTQNSKLPELIICDRSVSEMDGFEFVKNIRNKDRFKSIRLIILTADPTAFSTKELKLSF